MGRKGSKGRVRFEVRDVDRGWKRLQKLVRDVARVRHFVKVGLVGPKAWAKERKGKGISVVEVAAVNEYGSEDGRIPARPFIGGSFDRNRDNYRRLLRWVLEQAYFEHRDLDQLLGAVGQKASADVKAFVKGGEQVPPPNAPRTLAEKIRKGLWNRKAQEAGTVSTDPRTLVDSGQMINAVTYEVVIGEGEGGSG